MKKDKTQKNVIQQESDSEYENSSDESSIENESVENNSETESEPEPEPEIKKKLPRSRSKVVKTDVGEVLVKRGRKPKKKPIVVYLSESEDEEPQKVIVKKKKGRPKGTKDKCSIKYLDAEGNEHDSRNKANKTVIEHTEPERKMTMKELKLIALEEKMAEMEAITGKKLLSTKKGKVDQRTVKKPTDKQLAARAKFVENNAKRRLAKKMEKENDAKKLAKDSVKVVVDELVSTKKANSKKKAEILAEIKQESEKVKKVEKTNDDLFN